MIWSLITLKGLYESYISGFTEYSFVTNVLPKYNRSSKFMGTYCVNTMHMSFENFLF